MSCLGLVSLRIASAIAIFVFVPAWHFNSTHSPSAYASVSQAESAASTANSLQATDSPIAANLLSAAYGKLPISFEANNGQTDPSVQFLARGAGYTLFLTPAKPSSPCVPNTGTRRSP
jgi:hypothetical protein